MATGETYHSLAFHFRVGVSTVSGAIEETTRTICGCLRERYMPIPSEELFLKCEHKFRTKWNFPNCFGCVDGKHVRIRNPDHAGSMYHNYKQFFPLCYKVYQMLIANSLQLMLELTVDKVMEELFGIQVYEDALMMAP